MRQMTSSATDHADSQEMSAAAVGRALEVLRLKWGDLYLIGYDGACGWYAALSRAIAHEHGPMRLLESVS